MSKRTYIGSPAEATKDWTVELDPADDLYYIMIAEEIPCDCGCPRCTAVTVEKRKHSSHTSGKWPGSEEPDELIETIEALQEDLDQDYEQYCEENAYEIRQQERWEDFMREQ